MGEGEMVHPGVADGPVACPLRPLAIDLFCGLGGWSEGLIAAGWHVVGFDLEDMRSKLGEPPLDHHSLVIQDVLTLHGSQFRGADLIVGSSPCQEFSYRAMPWKRAKALGPPELGMKLFEAQFRIQREACAAAGRKIPLVVENVQGAQKWVGRARWNFGSYYLWGDLPALMPLVIKRDAMKLSDTSGWRTLGDPRYPASAGSIFRDGRKLPGFRFDGSGRSFQTESVKVAGLDWSGYGKPGYKARAFNGTAEREVALPSAKFDTPRGSSRRRVAASAKIAKIPFTLAEWIGHAWLPMEEAA